MEDGKAEEDPVIHEMDVYLSKSLADSLYVLQYPSRPPNLPFSNLVHTVSSARVKPQQKMVEIALGIETRSVNYCKGRGEQFSMNLEGGNSLTDEQPYFKSGTMDTQVLRSAPSCVNADKYALAVLKDGELHLTPVHAVAQMCPAFDYLDKAEARQKADAAARTAAAGGDSSQDEEDEVEAVTVKFAARETDEAKARRLASCQYIQKQVEEERWCPLEYHPLDDKDAVEPEFQLLYADHDSNRQQQFLSTATEYLDAMLPKANNDELNKPVMPNNILTRQQLKQMPLADSVRALLTNVKVIQFSKLMEMLPEGSNHEATLRTLQQVAVMVQGCWVVKSEVLYPSDSTSPHSGISADQLILVRDLVLWKFTHCRHVVRRDIASGLPGEDLKEILEQMSVFRSSKGWEFIFDYDTEFEETHLEVTHRQKLLWDSKFETLCQHFKLPKDAHKKAKEAQQTLRTQNAERPRRRRASRKRTLSGRSMSESDWDMETDAAGDRHIGYDGKKTAAPLSRENMEVCGEDFGSGALSKMSLSNGDSRIPDLVNKNGDTSQKSEQLKRELVALAHDLMTKMPVLKFSLVKEYWCKKRHTLPRDHLLSVEVSDRMLKEAVLEAGGVEMHKLVYTKQDPDTMFAYVHQGNRMDKVRKVLCSMLDHSGRVKSSAFISRVKDAVEDEFSDYELKKVLKELCESHNSMWYLKGTAPSS